MKKKLLILFASFFIALSSFGQNNFNVNFIADTIQKNANAVIRFYNTSHKNISNEKFITDVHYAITILNPNGKHAAELAVIYDRNTSVSDIKGYLFNEDGILLNKLKSKDILDYAANGAYSLFSDNRVKYYNPAVSIYPFTIEYKYTIESSSIIGFETWMPQKWFNISVENAELAFCTNDTSHFKYLELNHEFTKSVLYSNNSNIYTWKVKNLKAIEFEPHAPNYLEFMPAVLLSPNNIKYEKTSGDFSTWESYGKWVYSLINKRDELPEETIKYIHNLTDTIENKEDKIKAIYQYMQSKTRYVNVALGIGGFQPMLAYEVDKKGYGDCKALSNYTLALLKSVGITSFYTEIGTGKYQQIKFPNFASANQTNHIILCVPLIADTVWLECTNQNIPFGFLPPSSQNRYALLIKPTGGELVKTPSFSAKENIRISNINMDVNKKGEVNFEINTEYNNSLYNNILPLLNTSSKEQKEYLHKYLLSSNNAVISKILIQDNSNNIAKAKLNIEGKLNNFASVVGSRILFSPYFFHNNDFLDFLPQDRKLEVFEPISYSYTDTLRISFPEGYSLDYIQNSIHVNSIYGQFEFTVDQVENQITILRKISINEGTYNFLKFDEINEFLRSVSDYQNKMIVINSQ